MLLVRSLLFDVLFYSLMVVMGILCAPLALWSRGGAYWSIHRFLDIIFVLLRMICGLRAEVRGPVPTGEVVIAAKHQSFLDILILAHALKRPKFIMKKELRWAPVLGFYAMRIGSTPVDRGKKAKAVKEMMTDVETQREDPGQIVIYPQGTRVAPGADRPYKVGAGVIYDRLQLECHPAATNAGVFWGRKSMLRRPGLAVVEFLEPVPPGMEVQPFIALIRDRIETASDKLVAEAGE